MSRRHQTLPPAQTSSAREALQSFYCQLCSKGYTRMNDYEAHLSSYDHTHKQRLKDMKAMVRDPGAAARARRAEAKADAVVSIKIGTGSGSGGGGGGGGGFKKGGFKKSGFKAAFVPVVAAADKAAAAVATPECGSPVSNKDSVVAWSKGFATPAASDYTDCTSVADQEEEDVDLQDAESDSGDDDDDDDDGGYNTYNPRFPTA